MSKAIYGLMTSNLHRTFKRAVKEECNKQDINVTYFPFYIVLSNQSEPIKQDEVVKATRFAKPTVSLTLKKMEQEGLVERVVSESDSRIFLVSLSEKGRAQDALIKKSFEKIEEKLIKNLSEEELDEFEKVIGKMMDNLKEDD